MRRRKDELDKAGALVIGITPMDSYRCATLRKSGGDEFAMIPDPARRLAAIYGVKYSGFFVLDSKGVIRYAWVADGRSDTTRPDADHVLSEIKKLAK